MFCMFRVKNHVDLVILAIPNINGQHEVETAFQAHAHIRRSICNSPCNLFAVHHDSDNFRSAKIRTLCPAKNRTSRRIKGTLAKEAFGRIQDTVGNQNTFFKNNFAVFLPAEFQQNFLTVPVFFRYERLREELAAFLRCRSNRLLSYRRAVDFHI